jgi:dihydrofolate reductase
MRINVILAHCHGYGIGYAGKMCWRIGSDMRLFAKLTTGRGDYKNAVVMGRKTWQSLPSNCRPLALRDNLVLSRSIECGDGIADPPNPHVAWFSDIDAVLSHCSNRQYDEVWIIGGEQLYSAFLGPQAPHRSLVHTVHVTRIDAAFTCDTFCSAASVSESALQEYFTPVSRRTELAKCVDLDLNVTFCEYVNKLHA